MNSHVVNGMKYRWYSAGPLEAAKVKVAFSEDTSVTVQCGTLR